MWSSLRDKAMEEDLTEFEKTGSLYQERFTYLYHINANIQIVLLCALILAFGDFVKIVG